MLGVDKYFLHDKLEYLRFQPGKDILILPKLSSVDNILVIMLDTYMVVK